MSDRLIRSDEGVTLIGGGRVQPDDLELALGLAPLLVAADGGADRALALNRMPAAVIGDLDSLSPEGRARIAPERLHHIAEQDDTDFEKCLRRIDAPVVLAVGFTGGRIDHELAAMNVLARRPGPECILIGAEDLVFLLPPEITLDLPKGSRFSLFPMGRAGGTSRGLRWPIDGLHFAPNGISGTSNEVTGAVHLQIDGPMLAILPREALRLVLAALG